jgi:hypothetical protein
LSILYYYSYYEMTFVGTDTFIITVCKLEHLSNRKLEIFSMCTAVPLDFLSEEFRLQSNQKNHFGSRATGSLLFFKRNLATFQCFKKI